MEKLRTLLLSALCLVAIATVTSCVNNDDDETYTYVPLTRAEQALQLSQMQGYYTGKVYYFKGDYLATYNTDSLDAQWTISATDSTLNISRFPLKIFAPFIYDSKLQEALVKDSTQTLRTLISPYRPWGTSGTLEENYFSVVPYRSYGTFDYTAELPILVDGEQNSVKFTFAPNYAQRVYSAGIYYQGAMSFSLILSEVCENGGVAHTTNTYCTFVGKMTTTPPAK